MWAATGGAGGPEQRHTFSHTPRDPLPYARGRGPSVLTRPFEHDAAWGQAGRRDTAWSEPGDAPSSRPSPRDHTGPTGHSPIRGRSVIIIRAWGREDSEAGRGVTGERAGVQGPRVPGTQGRVRDDYEGARGQGGPETPAAVPRAAPTHRAAPGSARTRLQPAGAATGDPARRG